MIAWKVSSERCLGWSFGYCSMEETEGGNSSNNSSNTHRNCVQTSVYPWNVYLLKIPFTPGCVLQWRNIWQWDCYLVVSEYSQTWCNKWRMTYRALWLVAQQGMSISFSVTFGLMVMSFQISQFSLKHFIYCNVRRTSYLHNLIKSNTLFSKVFNKVCNHSLEGHSGRFQILSKGSLTGHYMSRLLNKKKMQMMMLRPRNLHQERLLVQRSLRRLRQLLLLLHPQPKLPILILMNLWVKMTMMI